MSTASRPRDRARTEQAVLDAARQLFAEVGYERATIRGVAALAEVDPALVMQQYGSKEGLFAAAASWPTEQETVMSAPRQEVPTAALDDLFSRFEGADREAAVALMRSCLTHPSAVAVVRDEVMCERAAAVARTIGGEDAELRAGLVGATLIGLAMARYLLEIEPVASADQADLRRLLEPVLRQLVGD